MHLTPTGAFWLNMVERFFGDILETRIKRASFTSIAKLDLAIALYVGSQHQPQAVHLGCKRHRHLDEGHARRGGSGGSPLDKCRTEWRTTRDPLLAARVCP